MNPTLALPIIVVLLVVIAINQVVYLRRKESRSSRFLSSGGLFFLAVFCGFCFLGAGELEGERALMWSLGATGTALPVKRPQEMRRGLSSPSGSHPGWQ